VLHDFDLAHELGLAAPEALLDPAVLERRAAQVAALVQARVSMLADGRDVQWEIGGIRPLPDRLAVEIAWQAPVRGPVGHLTLLAALFPYDPNHQTFVNVYEEGVLVRQDILDARRGAAEYYTRGRQGAWAVFKAFTAAGVHHIAIGPDHILFIVGLLLLGGSIPRLLGIVTAFTLGHSVTLSLAALNLVAPPSQVIEPAIALSIVYVGADNLLAARGLRCSSDSCTASGSPACCAKSGCRPAPSGSRCSRSTSASRSARPFSSSRSRRFSHGFAPAARRAHSSSSPPRRSAS
jgi:hypothetical protein